MSWFEIVRRTPAEWAADDPILLDNQIGVESDVINNVETIPNLAKLGDGFSNWSDLDYWTPFSEPTPPLAYRALLTQTSTNAPVATVLENTLGGTVVWARTVAGIYTATLTGAFPAATTFIQFNEGAALDDASVLRTASCYRTSDNEITLETLRTNLITTNIDPSDGELTGSSIEILVFA